MKNPHQQQRKPTDHNGFVGRRMWCASRREWVRVLEALGGIDFWVKARTGGKFITSSLHVARLIVLLCACTAFAQPSLPDPSKFTAKVTTNITARLTSPLTNRVIEINGKLYTNVVRDQVIRKAHIGWRIQWDYDPALLQFVSFRAYALTNVGKTNSEILWGVTTNTHFDYIASADKPMMFQPRIEAVDVALPKTSGGRTK